MLQKNKIFLSLLGSFYNDTAYTDFSKRLDYIYTSSILNRYVNTLRKTILSRDGVHTHNNIHFGFINISEIDIATKTIVVRDIHNTPVSDVNFISLAYLDIERFYSVSDGVVDAGALSALSGYSVAQIPIVYMIDVNIGTLRNGIYKFVDNMSDIDFFKIRESALRIVSDQMIYFPETLKLLHKLSNILLGALYSTNEEVVLSVSETMVVTTRNTYYLNGANEGRAVVSVGDLLTQSQLVTELAYLSSDVSFINDLSKMTSYVNSIMPSYSNTVFLRKISSAIAKKRAAIVIAPDVFAAVDTEVISAVNLVFKLSSLTETHTTSNLHDSLNIDMDENNLVILSSSSNIDVSMSGYWDLSISIDNTVVEAVSDEKILSTNTVDVLVGDAFILDLEPVIDSMDISLSDESVYRIDSLSGVTGTTTEITYGDYIETVISDVIEDGVAIGADSSIGEVSDTGPTFSKGTISLDDNIMLGEETIKTISVKHAMNIVLSDILSTIGDGFDAIGMDSDLNGEVEVLDSIVANARETYISIIESTSDMNIDMGNNNNSLTVETFETISLIDSNNSEGLYIESKTVELTIDDQLLVLAKQDILLADESDVESENQIDS